MSQHFPLPESEGGWRLLDKEIDKSVASNINYEQLFVRQILKAIN
ncbi:MAG: hypothetical protein ACJ0HV_04920 [Candidatus Pseudothioglobus sp.]